jgi:aspartate kinase
MSLIVQKFGGTSVASSEHIRRVAARIGATRRAGHDVIAVVSAMGSTTDDLAQLAREVNAHPPPREMDMLLTAGERISMALLAIALEAEGIEAVSLTGSQAGILTEGDHGSAEIQEVRSFRVQEGLDAGRVVIVAGFQGVDPTSKDVTTLGRGGSDVTAVELAAAHGAMVCEIYTDVDGVYTADPKLVPDARRLDEITFDEMVTLAECGAEVLMHRAVAAGRRSRVPIQVRSSFTDGSGTWVVVEAREEMLVRGIAYDVEEVVVTVVGAGVHPGIGIASRVEEALERAGIRTVEVAEASLRVSCLVERDRLEASVQALHTEFDPPTPMPKGDA